MHSQPPKSPLSGGLWQLRALVNVHLFLEFTINLMKGAPMSKPKILYLPTSGHTAEVFPQTFSRDFRSNLM